MLFAQSALWTLVAGAASCNVLLLVFALEQLLGCIHNGTCTRYWLFILMPVKLIRVERLWSLVRANTCKFGHH